MVANRWVANRSGLRRICFCIHRPLLTSVLCIGVLSGVIFSAVVTCRMKRSPWGFIFWRMEKRWTPTVLTEMKRCPAISLGLHPSR
jgi:hypothetical protein